MDQNRELKWVGVDLDDTLANNSGFPEFKLLEPLEGAKESMEKLVEMGYKPVIYTARGWPVYDLIEDWLNDHQIPFRRIVCGKMLVRYMIDDVNLEFKGNWGEVLNKIEPLEDT